MPERIRFYFDPLCPWCYQTSRWARHLEEQGEVAIEWRVFSLAIANRGGEGRAASGTGAAPALRTAIAVRREHGDAAVGRFYAALGLAIHERGEAADEPDTIATALRASGLDESLGRRALEDARTWQDVQAEHDEVVTEHKAFGVPTIVLEGGQPMFGPIIVSVPEEKEAVELWRHFSWLARNPNFAEVKRERNGLPDLESVRRWKRRAAEERATAESAETA